ncbi:MAG: hypothetical protein ISR69_03630, partial [Gammaproteobacteria bacterium]|nr:hypothetical protein [Gammaproteobacteria bacterium]
MAIAQGFATGIKQYLTLDSWQAGLYVVLLCSYQALPYGLFGLVYSSRVCSGGRYGALRSAACMTLILYLFPVPLPVFQVHSLYIFPILIQLLDIGGEPLLLFLFSLFNWLLVDLMLCLKHRVRTLQVSVSLLMLCIVVLGYGQFRLDGQLEKQESIDMEGGMRIVAIQPNVPLPGTLSDHKEEKEHALRALKEMTQKALATDWELSLVVWPEAPIHMSLEPGSDDWAQFEALSRQQAVPLMINGSRIEPDSGREYNASALLDNGERLAEYRKQILFPFAEYIPGEEQLLFLRTL